MDSVRIEKQPGGDWKVHVPNVGDFTLTPSQLAELIEAVDRVKPETKTTH